VENEVDTVENSFYVSAREIVHVHSLIAAYLLLCI